MTTQTKPNWPDLSARERDQLVTEMLHKYMGRDYEVLPHYTTDIAAAFSVLEAMRREGYVVRMDSDFDMYWGITLYNPKMAGASHANASSLPEAICLAALRAKGVL